MTTRDIQPLAPSGTMSASCLGLGLAAAVDGADRERVAAGDGVPVEAPLAPRVTVEGLGELRGPERPVVDPHLDGLDASGLRPGHAADGRRGAAATPLQAAACRCGPWS